MQFKEIIGHRDIKEKLIQTVNNKRISHAQLFLGKEGCGNLALAIAYAQYINCFDKKEQDSCGKCKSCLKYNKLIHPDLHFAFPVTTTATVKKNPISDNFIKIWREKLIENPYFSYKQWLTFIKTENKQGSIGNNESYQIIKKLSRKTYEAKYKVIIIWMAETMNETAANKLLKIIEEPPENTVFLLVAENSQRIIQTILSRTQIIKISGIEPEEICKILKEKHSIPAERAKKISRISAGNYLKTLDLLEKSEESKENFDLFTELMRLCYSKKIIELINWSEKLSKKGREAQKKFLTYTAELIRENFILNITKKQKEELIFIDGEEADFSDKFSLFINKKNAGAILEEINNAHFHISRNVYSNLVLTDFCLKISRLLNIAKKK